MQGQNVFKGIFVLKRLVALNFLFCLKRGNYFNISDMLNSSECHEIL